MDKTDDRKRRFRATAVLVALMMFGSIAALQAPASAGSDPCTGSVESGIDRAKSTFRDRCGRSWDDQQRDQCTWVNRPSGWLCHQYAPNGVSAPSSGNADRPPTTSRDSSSSNDSNSSKPNRPSGLTAGDVGRYNSVVWRLDRSIKGVNVYRNGRYVASVNVPNNVYNDYSGNAGDRYHLVAYDNRDRFSDRSPDTVAVGVVPSVQKVRWHPRVVKLSWTRAPGSVQLYEVYRDRTLVGRTTTPNYVDRGAGRNNTYTIRTVDRSGSRSPASPAARYPAQLRSRSGQVVTSGQTAPMTVQLTSSRTFRGTMTVDNQTGITMSGNVYDRSGNNLGTLEQRHDGATVQTISRPTYGSPVLSSFQGDPMELSPGTTYEQVANGFPSRPRRPSGGGGGGGGGTTPGGGNRQPTGAPGVEFDENGYPQGDNAGP